MSKPAKTQAQLFAHNFGILSASAVGVILTRTREPHRCAEALKLWAFQNRRSYRVWSIVNGWTEHRPDGQALDPDRTLDLYAAIKKVGDIDGGGAKAWVDSVSVVHYPHWVLSKHPSLIQLLKEYVRAFTENKQRIDLLCPEGTTLPQELENDISVLDFELPCREALEAVYTSVIEVTEDTTSKKSLFSKGDMGKLVSAGGGMTESEFETALSKAIVIESAAWPNVPLARMLKVVMDTKTEVVKRSEVLEVMEAGSMDDIAGLEVAKEWIGKRKPCFSQDARDFGVDVPKGICCVGPPGTGKSLLAKAIASTLGVPLILFKVAKVCGSLVGQSEQRTASAFKQIEAMAPCCVLIDEIDKAGIDPRQGGGDSGTSSRVMGSLLTQMQESKAQIFWVLTANRVAGLPPELLRKGRLDEVFAVLPPKGVERLGVLEIHLRKRKQDPTKIKDLSEAVGASAGFVSAEIEAAVKEAVVDAYTSGIAVTGRAIAAQLRNMKPISEAFADDFNARNSWAQNNARMASLPEVKEAPEIMAPRQRRRNIGQ